MRWCLFLVVVMIPACSPEPDTEEEAFDCTQTPKLGDIFIEDFANVGEEFMFDAHGFLVTRSDDIRAVVRTARDGSWTITGPLSSTEIAGIDIMIDGDLVIADEGSGTVRRMAPDGTEWTVRASLNQPNSIVVDQHDYIWVTAYDQILRMNADTGEDVLVMSRPGSDLDGLTFSPDFRYLWYNEDSTGLVGRLKIDNSGQVIAQWFDVAELNTDGAQLDGMAMDICGNLYITRTDGNIFRLNDDQSVDHYIDLSHVGEVFSSSAHFGSGVDGWERDHLYIMDRWGRLFDVDVGIPGAPEPHFL